MNGPLPIAFRDRWLVVIDKPAGLPTSGRTLEDPNCAQFLLAEQLGEPVWAVHQIDAGTTGLNLFVRRKSAVEVFTDKLKKGEKHYLAVVSGVVPWDAQIIEAPIGHDDERRTWVVAETGRAARSDVTVLSRGSATTVVNVRIHTGRTHQVRVHLSHVGHPLLGDTRYGGPAVPGFDRPALHAHRIRLPGVPDLEAPIPADLAALLGRLQA